MTNRVAEFLLAHYPDIAKIAKGKIKELALTTLDDKVKKAQLDAFVIEQVDKLIDNYDMKRLPDAIIDPQLKKLVAKYIPAITQSIYDLLKDKIK